VCGRQKLEVHVKWVLGIGYNWTFLKLVEEVRFQLHFARFLYMPPHLDLLRHWANYMGHHTNILSTY
jgi:hypothetical protein